MPTKPKSKNRNYGYRKPREQGYVREPSAPEYHTSRWKRESKLFKEQHPLCALCEKEGKLTPAEVTDHIVPFPVCDDFFDSSNWQALCRRHNIEKGNRDKRIIQQHRRARGG